MKNCLLLVGGGKMGAALITGWLERGADPANLFVVEPSDEARGVAASQGVTAVRSPSDLPSGFAPDVVIFAVKPQVMEEVVPAYAGFEEHSKGSLQPDKLADLVVLSHDPFEIPVDALKDIEVETTIVGGQLVHSR